MNLPYSTMQSSTGKPIFEIPSLLLATGISFEMDMPRMLCCNRA
jgi:hypothetical protein